MGHTGARPVAGRAAPPSAGNGTAPRSAVAGIGARPALDGVGARPAVGEAERRPVFMAPLSTRRLVALDGVAAAAYTLVLLATAFARPTGPPLWAVCATVAAIGLPITVRRLWPLPVFAVVFASTALSLFLGAVREPFLAAAFALYPVALAEPRRPREPTLLIGVVSAFFILLAAVGGQPRGAGGGYLPAFAVIGPAALGGAWTIGRAVRERRAYAARAAGRLAERAVTEERLRIARELHDVVSHTLSLIGVKAGVAGYLLRADDPGETGTGTRTAGTRTRAGPGTGGGAGTGRTRGGTDGIGAGIGTSRPGTATAPGASGPGTAEGTGDAGAGSTGDAGGHGRALGPAVPVCGSGDGHGGPGPEVAVPAGTLAEVRDTLRVIETTSREALVEMHHMLGVLRDGGTTADPPPAPGVTALAELAERAAAAGVRVELTVRDAGTLPDGLGRSVYRIVQEAVTNVIRHAAPARCRVTVEADRTEVRIRVTDDGPGGRTAPGAAGHGIIGMRERALMHGGSLTAGPRPEGGFEVSARLPRSSREEPR